MPSSSWNGGGFDLPVLHYRALLHGVQAPRYWEMGDEDTAFRYNNYLSRFHWRHLDVMDVLSGHQNPRLRVARQQHGVLAGAARKRWDSMARSVWDTYLRWKLCSASGGTRETDVAQHLSDLFAL